MRIVITEVMDEDAVDWLKARFDVCYDPKLVDQRPRLLAAMKDADAVIVKSRVRVNQELLDAGPKLKAVGRLGSGLDNIDLDACKARNVAVYAATGANARSVAEYVICVALMLLRPGGYTATARVAAGEWPYDEVRNGHEMDGKTLGIAGLGSIGRLVARLANALGMKVIAWAPTKQLDDPVFAHVGARAVSLETLLAEADIVTLHIPLVPETRGLMNRERIGAMKKGAILINTARGAVVDNAALIDALTSGHLYGAAVDVYEEEPLPAGSIFAQPVPRLLLTPHLAGPTIESAERRGVIVAQRVAEHLTGSKG